jgi:hypothetical protein
MNNPFHALAPLMRKVTLRCLALIVPMAAAARSPVDIGLFRTGNELEIRLKPHGDFDGVVSNVVFSIRWQRAVGVALGAPQQPAGASTYIPVIASGGMRSDGSYDHLVYTGFGMEPIRSTAQLTWRAGQEYVIVRIPFSGNADFTLASDPWIKSVENNGGYYISLGGHDVTGQIYKDIETVTDQLPFSIAPNPCLGQFTLSMPLDPRKEHWFELFNAAGQLVLTERMVAGEKGYLRHFDVRGEGAGVYHMRIHRGDETENQRIVVGS